MTTPMPFAYYRDTNADGTARTEADIAAQNKARDAAKLASVTIQDVSDARAGFTHLDSVTLTALSAPTFRVGSIGVDFSWSKPPPSSLSGHDFVMPYIPYSGDGGKSCSPAQLQSYLAAGKVVIVLWEVAAGDCLRGYSVGFAHGTQARAGAESVGLPHGLVIIAACDTNTDWTTVKPYMDGFTAGLGGAYRPGAYGGIKVTDGAVAAGLVGFQTVAWSYGQVGGAHVLQDGFNYFPNGTSANCDRDRILRTPVGGWGETETEDTLSQAEVDQIITAFSKSITLMIKGDVDANGQPVTPDKNTHPDNLHFIMGGIRSLSAAVAAIPTVDEIKAAVNAGQVDVAALTTALAPQLAPLLSAAIGQPLSTDQLIAAVTAGVETGLGNVTAKFEVAS